MHDERYKPAGLLARLRRDRGGNVLAIMAASLIPLLGFAGSAADMARLYMVRSRLQQACDAGTLAGRRAMTDTSLSTPLDATARTQANSFFFNNFPTDAYGSRNLSFTPGKAAVAGSATANVVNGTASVTVPMVVMKVFGINTRTVAVTCQARFDVADTDILFVLDTTGSMACLPTDNDSQCSTYAGDAGRTSFTRQAASGGVGGYAGSTGFGINEQANSRIAALRTAVLNFYDTFAANADASTHVRYGFVTYASSVNVGRAILDVAPNFLMGAQAADTPFYQSRRVAGDYTISTNDEANGKAESACTNPWVRTPSTEKTYDTNTGTATRVRDLWADGKCYKRTQRRGPQWEHLRLPFDVSGVVAGNVVTNPTKVRGQTMRWLGCVETPVDQPGQSTFVTTSLPREIDPDARPTGDARWFPHMQDLEYVRNGSFTDNGTDLVNGDNRGVAPGFGTDAFVADSDAYERSGGVACGKPVRRLGVMTRDQVRTYVTANDFVPTGGTYHDVGMIWGARLISPTGPWAADTAAWSGRNAPNRVIIFMTDGTMSPTVSSYGMYGMEGYDRRVGNGDFSNLTDLHNRRFLAACAAARARNIDVWTIAIDDAANPNLQTCATTPAQALFTTTGDGLSAAFSNIARRLAMLRLSQ